MRPAELARERDAIDATSEDGDSSCILCSRVTVRPLPLLLVLLVLLAAAPLVAGYASRDLVIPVAGHAVRGDGRVFETTLWITNVSTRDAANVTVTFYAAGRTHTPPHESTLQLAPRETRITPVADSILGAPNGIGWLHVEATSDVCVDVEIASRLATDPPSRALSTTLAAIPRRFAIGSGQSVLLHGVSLHPAYLSRFYVAETNGQDLHFALILLDAAGRELARKLSFVSAHEQLSGELASEFPNIAGDVAAVRIEPVNGGGRIVVAGTRTARDSQDTTAFEMSLPTEARNRVPIAELVAYGVIALAVAATAFAARRK
jgi:hypothetical protein